MLPTNVKEGSAADESTVGVVSSWFTGGEADPVLAMLSYKHRALVLVSSLVLAALCFGLVYYCDDSVLLLTVIIA